MSATTTAPSPSIRKVPVFSLGRVWTLAISTLTQLVRMKFLYFLFVFAFLILLWGNFNFASSPVQSLSAVKKVAFGALDVFAWLFAIVATALLIPRDIEDRTLYTILSKPVRRLEYLLGKLCGVLLVIGISISVIFAVCAIMILWKQSGYIYDITSASGGTLTEDARQEILLIQKNGFQPAFLIAALATFMKATVVAAVTILLSTIASSSLFTIIVSMLVFLVGHAHTMMSNFWLAETDNSMVAQMLIKFFKIIIPNIQIFSFSEGIVQGAAVVPSLVWQMAGLTGLYLVVFMLLALLAFVDKEF